MPLTQKCYFGHCSTNFYLKGAKRSMLFIKSLYQTTVGWHFFTKSQKPKRAMWFSHSLDPKDSKKPKFDHLCRRTFSGFSRILYFCLYLYVLCLFRIALSLWAILCMLVEMREYSLLYYGGFFLSKKQFLCEFFGFEKAFEREKLV